MKQLVYTVHAYRWGDRELHSYIVGVYQKKHAAIKSADAEQAYRGGKYECEIIEWTLGEGMEARHLDGSWPKPKTVRELPGNTLRAFSQAKGESK